MPWMASWWQGGWWEVGLLLRTRQRGWAWAARFKWMALKQALRIFETLGES